jgi:hypothetical protein
MHIIGLTSRISVTNSSKGVVTIRWGGTSDFFPPHTAPPTDDVVAARVGVGDDGMVFFQSLYFFSCGGGAFYGQIEVWSWQDTNCHDTPAVRRQIAAAPLKSPRLRSKHEGKKLVSRTGV